MRKLYMADGVGDGKPVQPDPINDQPWYTGHEAESAFEVGGEKLTLKQLQEGYLRQSDYTKKTQDLAEERRRLSEPPNKPEPQAKPGYPQTTEAWFEWEQKAFDVLGSDPAKFMDKINEVSASTARELLTNYELSREVDQALEANPRFAEIFGDDAKDTLWDRFTAELAKNGNVKAKDVCARLLTNIPAKPEEIVDGRPKTKLQPERGASPVGPKKDDVPLFDKKGNLTTKGFNARMDEAERQGVIPKTD